MIMFDRFHPRDGDDVPARRHDPRLADREVPIARALPADIHRWLDGELAESTIAHRADYARHLELWERIERDIEDRRRLTMPPYMVTRIMEAIAL